MSQLHTVNRVESGRDAEGNAVSIAGAERPLHRESIADGATAGLSLVLDGRSIHPEGFSPGAGLFIVIVGFVISTVFWYYEMPLVTYAGASGLRAPGPGSLLPGSRRDDLLSLPEPGAGPGFQSRRDAFHPFDLAVGERYRQERIRVEELRKRGGDGRAVVSPLCQSARETVPERPSRPPIPLQDNKPRLPCR